jgi:hypothetical protein
VSTEGGFYKSEEDGIFSELLLLRNSAEFHGIPCAKFCGILQNTVEFCRIPRKSEKILHGIPEEIPALVIHCKGHGHGKGMGMGMDMGMGM